MRPASAPRNDAGAGEAQNCIHTGSPGPGGTFIRPLQKTITRFIQCGVAPHFAKLVGRCAYVFGAIKPVINGTLTAPAGTIALPIATPNWFQSC